MHVLVALDDSEPARVAFDYALETFPDADITAVHVVDISGSVYGEYGHVGADALLEQKREDAAALFDDLLETAPPHDGSITTETAVGSPARELVAYADEHDVDHVVIGSHGRSGVSRVLLGSVAEVVARRAPCPVTIVR
ncbi:universal stress protein [Natronobiforma cellulositropha]|uniref:universal stress protein n=1 Tax=Natronobiforma cellulositropha TaxID=1679076 RepID=UPI0021D58BDD|nr:universal stress protein [Natronobiforma cellulositropha]